MKHTGLILAAAGALVLATGASAGTLDDIKAKGFVQCGVSTGVPGFEAPDDAGMGLGSRHLGEALEIAQAQRVGPPCVEAQDRVRLRPEQERLVERHVEARLGLPGLEQPPGFHGR